MKDSESTDTKPLPSRVVDLDRGDIEIAGRIVEERLLPEPTTRGSVLKFLADLIQHCREHPAGWGITLQPFELSLNAGWCVMFRVQAQRSKLALHRDHITPEAERWISEHAISFEKRFVRTYPDLALLTAPVDILAARFELFGPAAGHAVAEALRTKKGRLLWWEAHSPGFLGYLEQEVGESVPHPDYSQVAAGTRYWKISPGAKAWEWDECRVRGFIAMGWSRLGDLRQFEDRDQFEEARQLVEREEPTYTKLGAGQVWTFRHIAPGDRVVANRGTSEILGIGTVLGPYEYRHEEERHPHRLPVRWDDTMSWPVEMPGWRRTLIELGKAQFERLIGKDDGLKTPPKHVEALSPKADSFDSLISTISGRGLFFPTETVANVLLALQTKRFVILTGISGTGKTKIAQEIARHYRPVVVLQRPGAPPEDAIEIIVAPYMRKYRGFIVPVEMLSNLDLPAFGETNSAIVEVAYPDGELEVRLWKDPSRPVARLALSHDLGRWFRDSLQEGEAFWLQAPQKEDGGPFFRLSVPRVIEERQELDNYEVVAVRPDWTDSRGLLGFYNPLTQQYMSTPFLDLLLRAAAEEQSADEEARDAYPFFVVLDEMNLARVEHYFSDFLSALESGETIDLHGVDAVEDGQTETGRPIPKELRVPRNVFFLGTVNVDESTYMFSPKVLDRAFTIELNEVDLLALGDLETRDSDTTLWLSSLPPSLLWHASPGPDHWRALCQDHRDVAERTAGLNRLLEVENRHFGYRVANEIACYVLLAAAQAGADGRDVAFDLAVLQKVLPKLHGTQQELEDLLDRLFAFAVLGEEPADRDVERLAKEDGWRLMSGGRLTNENPSRTEEEAETPYQPVLPRTAAKLWRMRNRLVQQGFTSFIE